ncbi:MAG: hypothetical protein LBH00_08190 [Planctomycetaceae bacterium]|jgi:transposase|nr:hypothetical protein [Planctomycetaceae bacterium]
MAKSYSMDLRTRTMNDIHNGRSERKTAEKFGVSRQWIQQLKRCVAEHPDATQNELAAMMKKFVKVSGSMIGRELKIPGFTYKKFYRIPNTSVPILPPSVQNRKSR